MDAVDRARLKIDIGRYYASQREAVGSETVDGLAAAMVAEDARIRKAQSQRMGLAAFVAAQVRFVPAWTWAVQLALVALMFAVTCASESAEVVKLAVGVLAAATVLVGVPTMQSSKLHGVAELEYSCPNDVASVTIARLVVLGCSSSLTVALLVGASAASLNIGAFEVALWACPPFFCSCAGSLALLRKTAPSAAMALCAVWTIVCSAVLMALANMLPGMYAETSLAVWTLAAAAALLWLARELACTFRAASAGLDAFSPHSPKTYY